MATGQTILSMMEVLNQELQLQAGEADVTKGLVALNMAQDWFETQVSLEPEVFGGAVSTVSTTGSQEYTTYPGGLLRVDKLQLLDSNSRPQWDLVALEHAGDHTNTATWPWNVLSSISQGAPRAYWADGTKIYWDPVPDTVYSVRYYGFASATDITASGTFTYSDIVMLPLASFAVRLLKLGIDDPSNDWAALASSVFGPVIQSLSNFRREGAKGLVYRYRHDT